LLFIFITLRLPIIEQGHKVLFFFIFIHDNSQEKYKWLAREQIMGTRHIYGVLTKSTTLPIDYYMQVTLLMIIFGTFATIPIPIPI
jgi:hypothetical protein